MKRYITWVPFWNNPHNSMHPDTNFNKNWQGVFTLTNTSYNGSQHGDARYIALIEGSDNVTLQERMFSENAIFGFVPKTEEEVLALLNEWYPVKEGHVEEFPNGYFSFVDGELVDSTPFEVPV